MPTNDSVLAVLYNKLESDMKLIGILKTRPKNMIRLDPIDRNDIHVDLPEVLAWSSDNQELYDLIQQNGMATFICNEPFLNEFYRRLDFNHLNLRSIEANKLTHLQVLSVIGNGISSISGLPPNLKELYADFNQIKSVVGQSNLVLLSVSHNCVDDQALEAICSFMPQLRCLNIEHNSISDIKKAVQSLHKCNFLRILIARNNPIALLKVYYRYLTEKLVLIYFDDAKYVKPQPPKLDATPPPPKVQAPPPDKKDSKKDTKKGPAPVEEIAPPPPPAAPIAPVQITQQDLKTANISLTVSNLEYIEVNSIDPSCFPADCDPLKTQPCFWLEGTFFGDKVSTYATRKPYDSVYTDAQENRLDFEYKFEKTTSPNKEIYNEIQKGIYIEVWKEEPILSEAEPGQFKPVMIEGQPSMKKHVLGVAVINSAELVGVKAESKVSTLKVRLFDERSAYNAYFTSPLLNQADQIKINMAQYEEKQKAVEAERLKRLEAQEAAKNQKKGGKDTKKAPEKKPGKKDGKDQPAEKKKIDRSDFPIGLAEFRFLGGKHGLIKCRKEMLAVKVAIK